jgi:hypothetical protein
LLLSPAGVHSDLAITITTQRPAASSASKQLVSSYKKKGLDQNFKRAGNRLPADDCLNGSVHHETTTMCSAGSSA